MNRVVYMNGEFVPESEARISIYDSALMFGDMVFEMTRSFKKIHFKLEEHIDRLYNSMKILRINCPLSKDEMIELCWKCGNKNEKEFKDDDEHRLMIDVTRGPLSIYEGNIEGLKSGVNVIIADFPLRWTVQGMGKLFDVGINAVIPSQRAIPSRLLDPKIKNRSRLHYMMANIQASLFKGEDNWPLLLDPDGFIAEGSGDNFFIVKGQKLYTPQGRNVLRGISREYVKWLGMRKGLICVERNIEPYDVYTADEAFMTGTPFCILPVASLDGIPIGGTKVFPITSILLKEWSSMVGVDIVSQIKQWDTENKKDGPSPYSFI